jgi:hypothetical protein
MSVVNNIDPRYLTSEHGQLRHWAFQRDLARGLSGQTPMSFPVVCIQPSERNTAGTSVAGASIDRRTGETLGMHRRGPYGGRVVRFQASARIIDQHLDVHFSNHWCLWPVDRAHIVFDLDIVLPRLTDLNIFPIASRKDPLLSSHH